MRGLRSWRLWLLAVVGLIAATAAWSVPAWVSEQQALRAKERDDELALLRVHAERHQDIARRLRETPFFNQPLTGLDASDLLNAAVPFEGPPTSPPIEEFLARSIPEHEAPPLALSPELDHAFAESWDAGVPSALLELDVGWMDGLEGRGSWNPYAGSPAFETDDFAVRLPKFLTLDRWARAALAQGLATGNIEAASRRVGRLAWLELTTSNPVGVASALAILRRRDRELAGRPGFVPLAPATADDAEKAIAFERSLALHCPEGCAGLTGAPLPPALECAVANAVAAELSIERWFNGQKPPSLPANPACHFEDIRFERQVLAQRPAGAGPFPSASLATLGFSLPSRVELGATLARVFLPSVFIRNRHGPVAHPSARHALERAPSP